MGDIWAYRVSRQGDISLVALSGEVDMSAEEELADVLLAELRRPGTAVLRVDLDAVTFLDSSAINVLVQVFNTARESGRHLHIVRAHRTPLMVLEMTGLMPLLAPDEGDEQ
ncbi:STAS domain-containing protein [Actinoplanes sp. NPDC049599]|uniref:STAS domain-containing protein n=1 Tax=Actinoplanes sp. NPDC049599 TaxID=3363903 RepID=UPI0037AD8E6D